MQPSSQVAYGSDFWAHFTAELDCSHKGKKDSSGRYYWTFPRRTGFPPEGYPFCTTCKDRLGFKTVRDFVDHLRLGHPKKHRRDCSHVHFYTKDKVDSHEKEHGQGSAGVLLLRCPVMTCRSSKDEHKSLTGLRTHCTTHRFRLGSIKAGRNDIFKVHLVWRRASHLIEPAEALPSAIFRQPQRVAGLPRTYLPENPEESCCTKGAIRAPLQKPQVQPLPKEKTILELWEIFAGLYGRVLVGKWGQLPGISNQPHGERCYESLSDPKAAAARFDILRCPLSSDTKYEIVCLFVTVVREIVEESGTDRKDMRKLNDMAVWLDMKQRFVDGVSSLLPQQPKPSGEGFTHQSGNPGSQPQYERHYRSSERHNIGRDRHWANR
jgi:hypothetical protein